MEAVPALETRLFFRVGVIHRPTGRPADLVVEIGMATKRDLQRNAHCWPLIANSVACDRALSMLGKDYRLSGATPTRMTSEGFRIQERPLCP
jgi:hypothetical protein